MITASCGVLQVHMQAIRCGGRFVEALLGTAGFWRTLHDTDDYGVERFGAVARDIQKATRIMQILCSEAKSRKDVSLIAKVCIIPTRLGTPRPQPRVKELCMPVSTSPAHEAPLQHCYCTAICRFLS